MAEAGSISGAEVGGAAVAAAIVATVIKATAKLRVLIIVCSCWIADKG
jgi:hypothetical protein